MVVLTSFPPPSEGICHEQPNTAAHVEKNDLGRGTLYIAESRVSWVSEEGKGFSLEYPSISLHAVSRDTNAFPKECLYLMIDAKLNDDDSEIDNSEDDEDGEVDDYTPITEIRFIPRDTSKLETMYHTLAKCQSLHPDPNDSISEDEDDDEEGSENFEDAEEDNSQEGSQSVNTEGGGDAFSPFQLPVPDILSGAQPSANGDQQEEPMDVSQFEDAEPEH